MIRPLPSAIPSLHLLLRKFWQIVWVEEFKDIPAEEVKAAVHKGWEEMAAARRDVQKKRGRNP